MATINRFKAGVRSCMAVEHAGVVYLSGQVAGDPSADIKGQTQQCLDKIDALLAEAGTSKSKLLDVKIYLPDILRDFKAMNEVYEAWLDKDNMPARACVEAKLARTELLVEIQGIAAK